MKVAVFTPTRRPGGLDLTISCLARQTEKDFLWIVQDELLGARIGVYDKAYYNHHIEVEFLMVPKKSGYRRNLAAAYNAAAETALKEGVDYLVSLQDYIWVPDNGIEMFLEVHEAVDRAIVTGLTSHSEKPTKEDIADIHGYYTIFKRPLVGKPEGISWEDVRAVDLYPEDDIKTLKCMPEHWEANWASIDMSLIREGIRWDEDYDTGVAYENMDFAKQVVKAGGTCVLDKRNHAISLPHKTYFAGEVEEIEEFSNREMFEQKWMAG